jgi:RHS repeat-associated protein
MQTIKKMARFSGFLLAVLLTLSCGISYSQTTVTLYPDIDAGIIQTTYDASKANNNYGAYSPMRAWAWTWSGHPYYWRFFIKFDLSSIPFGAIIYSANLTLYGVNHNPLTQSNACYLERVTSDWTEMGVTWNNQPPVTATGRVSLAQSTSSTQNYTINVGSLVQGWVNGDYSNYGLRLKLQSETYYTSMEFASSDHSDASKHPKLVVYYRMPLTSDYDKNHVQKYHPNEEKSSVVDVEVSNKTGSTKTRAYLDGFGRTIQGVGIEASPGGKDIIQPGGMFDAMGRPEKAYLPFATADFNGGSYVDNATESSNWTTHYGSTEDDYTYGQTLFEANPLGRPVKQGSPGSAWWLDSDAAVEYGYSSNVSSEVILWTIDGIGNVKTGSSAYYSANTLYKQKITNPDEKLSISYTNKSGQTILTKVQATASPTETSHAGWACTYYVYDDYGRLRRTLTPELVDGIYGSVTTSYTISSTTMNNLAFQQEYDHRGRIIQDKAPGTGWNYYVYDTRDRPVLTQDAKQRTSNDWTFVKYDALDRPVLSGIYHDTRTLSTMQSYVDLNVNGTTFSWHETKGTARHEYTNTAFPTTPATDAYLEATYYDDYSFSYAQSNGFTTRLGYSTSDKSDAISGMVTGIKVRKLGDGVTGWLSSVIYYDREGQVIQGKGENHLSGYDLVTTEYNFNGDPTKTEHVHNTTGATVTETEEFTYDHMGRLMAHTHKTGSQPAVTLSAPDYDELGRVVTENIGNSVESMDYAYNIQGWTTKNGTRGSDAFGMDIRYNTGITTGAPAQYGGNIAEVEWQHKSTTAQKFGYEYDKLNRLARANHSGSLYDVSGNDGGNIGYDLNGNIESLKREKNGSLIDNLTYTYTSGRLTRVEDAGTTDGFNNGNTSGDDYAYYDNGLLKYDKNKSILSNITYNEINLPEKITFSNNYKIKFIYRADGTKIQMKVENSSGGQVIKIDYVGNMVYVDGTLEQLLTSGGRVLDPTATDSDYEYFITDHLGSVRAVVDEGGTVRQTRDYYPFGMEMIKGSTASPQNRYGYQGKELMEEEGLDWQDFHARMYDPAIARFLAVDPQGQFASPYMAMGNNPMIMVDPDGEFVIPLLIGAAYGAFMGALGSSVVYTGTALASGNFDFGELGRAAALGAVGGAISGGIGSLFSNAGIGLGAAGQNMARNALVNSVGNIGASLALGEDFDLTSTLTSLGVGLYTGVIPNFSGVKGGAFKNIIAEMGYNSARGAMTGGLSGGINSALNFGDFAEGFARGAKTGAIGHAVQTGFMISVFGYATEPPDRALTYKKKVDYSSGNTKFVWKNPKQVLARMEEEYASKGIGHGKYKPIFRKGVYMEQLIVEPWYGAEILTMR